MGSLWLDTDGRPETCHRFRRLSGASTGAIDELRIAFTGDGLLWAGLAMHQDRGEAPFSHSDRDVLPTPNDSYRRGWVAAQPFHGGLPVEGNDRWIQAPAVIMVTASGFPGLAPGWPPSNDLGGLDHGDLPTSMLSVVGSVHQWRSGGDGSDQGHHGPLVDDSGGSVVGRATSCSASLRRAPSNCSLWPPAPFGLTRREQEVANLVLQGNIDRRRQAVLSPHTVQDHPKSIFRKSGVVSRRDPSAGSSAPASRPAGSWAAGHQATPERTVARPDLVRRPSPQRAEG